MDKNHFKLIISRTSNLVGSALKTNVIIDDKERSTVAYKSSSEFILPRKYTKVKLYNKVFLGRTVSKELVVDPVSNSIVEIDVSYKMNWIAMIPPFVWIIPVSTIITKIRYTP
jgi:hypothetical protein